MVRWQKDLFRKQPKLAQLSCTPKLLEISTALLHGREAGKITNHAYPQLLKDIRACLSTAGGVPVQFTSDDLGALEKEHRNILLALSKQ